MTCDGCGITLTDTNQFEDMTLCISCAREAEDIILDAIGREKDDVASLAARVLVAGPPIDPTP